ncbi:MAG TPA: pyruvate formate-lyase-activating protein [Coriobacteriia bacterium]|nr:pyruvate formate-lyase-activating protein [Coriobacteriia bacterium]
MSEGYVHSIEIGSFIDGPGLRFVVFLAGCPLRCQYCHNPDTWQLPAERTDSAALLKRISGSAIFLGTGRGGVTVSGGEPLMQPRFAQDLLEGSRKLGLHTALDTSGFLGDRASDELLDATDLVLLDIKSFDEATYRVLTGVNIAPTLRFAERLSARGNLMWIRFVLVPGLTDDVENVEGVAHFVSTLSCVERVEVLPFHQMGQHKWEELGIPYQLADTESPTPEMVERVKSVFRKHGLEVDVTRVDPCERTKEAG